MKSVIHEVKNPIKKISEGDSFSCLLMIKTQIKFNISDYYFQTNKLINPLSLPKEEIKRKEDIHLIKRRQNVLWAEVR